MVLNVFNIRLQSLDLSAIGTSVMLVNGSSAFGQSLAKSSRSSLPVPALTLFGSYINWSGHLITVTSEVTSSMIKIVVR